MEPPWHRLPRRLAARAALPPGPRGHVDVGLGKRVALGAITLIAPTGTINKNMDRRVIDGVEIVFQLAPGSEAPAEMLMYFPQFRVLDMAEDVTHNSYTQVASEMGLIALTLYTMFIVKPLRKLSAIARQTFGVQARRQRE